ncbi:hypothetical protein GSY74_04950 [Sulfurovum sp. bin170]|uniref:hypothetical protein n=1 Tax=Sulfurovum sp. bin170 TaxID=2695268 RepID=UPI0013DEF965|nr:hypothetical protein [Sulfurovum sp. bin170]NEW60624.1 hypothetical protein [Sulfurovum sp. bin170]
MFKYIKIYLSVIFLFMVLSCSNSDETTTKEVITEKISIEKNQTIEETVLQEMGFNFENEKIIIDFNKTNNFFLNMEKKLDEKAKEIEKKIQSADINVTRDVGVVITDEKLSIDLNSTKNLLNDISELFEEIILDINRTIN